MLSPKWFLLLPFLFTWTALSSAAVLPPAPGTVCPGGVHSGSPCYLVRGEITRADLDSVKKIAAQALNAKAPIRPLFYLDSAGGDIDAAMAIGRELRRISAEVIVEEKCFSACVLLMAGAVKRSVFSYSKVGIHRPYSRRTDERSYAAIQKEQDQLRERVRLFLEKMNLPSALYDAMLLVPPNEIRILSESDLAQYGLAQVDPVKQEMDDNKQARHYGITKEELFRRKADAKSKCASLIGTEIPTSSTHVGIGC